MAPTSVKTVLRQLQHPIPDKNLYQPDKFKVHVGEGTVGFCTVWNEPKAVVTLAPSLHQSAALVGTLYSSQGVNVIIRNLALNPFIKRVYIWGHGPLSKTKFGVVGSSVLRKLWADGVDEHRSLVGTAFKLEEEIDGAVFEIMRTHVELIDVSGEELSDAVTQIEQTSFEPYMEPVRFPDAQIRQPETFPSEEVGWIVRGKGVIDTWTKAIERIMRYGTVKGTQYGSQQKELIGLTWVIQSEDPENLLLPTEWPSELCEVTGATREAINEYHAVFLSPDKPTGVSYTYGNRLMRYHGPMNNLTLEEAETYVDQISDSIIRNLKASPDSRRAVATTLMPWIDAVSDEPPCITQLQALQARGKLNLLVTVRSHDMFKAAIPNAFGLRILQARIAKETGFALGMLQITSQSAHIYEADWENAKKLATCAFWERPVKKFYDVADADPRGIFLIRVQNKKIMVDFNTLNGEPLLQFEGSSADYIALQIAQHDLISQSGHALDIGIQLARAEIALKKGIEFIQDRPLVI